MVEVGSLLPKRMLNLLFLLSKASKVDSKTKLQKLVFLIDKEKGINIGYSFRPYIYGPYSFELSDDLDVLKSLQLIQVEAEEFETIDSPFVGKKLTFSLAAKGKELLDKNTQLFSETQEKDIVSIISEWNEKPLSIIISYVYSKYMK